MKEGVFISPWRVLISPRRVEPSVALSLKEITEVYVPIYEARLTGPKNKVGLLRLDAVRKKIL